MGRAGQLFDLASLDGIPELDRRLSQAFATRSHPPRGENAVYLDTFDRRLARAGGELEALREGEGRELVWRTESKVPLFARTPALPAFRDELPAGALRDALEERLERRRLFPLAEVERTRRTRDVLDEVEKTVARVELVERRARDLAGGAPGEWRALPPVLELSAVRGYDEWTARVERFLRADLGLTARDSGELEDALRSLGRPVGLPERLRIPPTASVPAAVCMVLRERLSVIEATEDGVARDLDPEFLHDFRVAIRWTRALLRRFHERFPALIEHYSEEFRWLGRACAPTRDLDVLIETVEDHADPSANGSRSALDPLRRRLFEARSRALEELVGVLRSERYRTLLTGWARFLAEDHPDGSEPIASVASTVLWKRFRKLRRRGKRLAADSPRERFHQVRVQGKELRYLVESFRDLYPAPAVEHALCDLTKLQSALGHLNDHGVHVVMLEEHARALPDASAETLLAIGRLVGRLESERERARERSLQRIAKLAGDKRRERFLALFHEAQPAP